MYNRQGAQAPFLNGGEMRYFWLHKKCQLNIFYKLSYKIHPKKSGQT